MIEIEKSLMKAVNDFEDPEWDSVISGAAFNLDFASKKDFLNYIDNLRHPIRAMVSQKKLERNIKKFGGDAAWIRYHRG